MNHTRTVVVLAAAGLLLTACSSTPKPRTPTACSNITWPRPIPGGIIGKRLTDVTDGPLLCFDITAATAPDNHDAFHDPAIDQWTVTGVSPRSGTPVTKNQPVTLTVDNHNS